MAAELYGAAFGPRDAGKHDGAVSFPIDDDDDDGAEIVRQALVDLAARMTRRYADRIEGRELKPLNVRAWQDDETRAAIEAWRESLPDEWEQVSISVMPLDARGQFVNAAAPIECAELSGPTGTLEFVADRIHALIEGFRRDRADRLRAMGESLAVAEIGGAV